ncbi:hypothetical protein RB2654_15310 [Rhodobacterales bacterium HTCC2654]|uniref:Uncharacterized protein n=1 Tax=Maritimibacter alkaliphilus HTCC2654 TaxID=314271 RepID=A3VHB1_9RHOB|nr:hypothetical protein RB2654_15310 [Rhodobacterales bacterium HTCC2654] [Maritimibacter alkaliphilus HTCC2654]
MSKRPIWSSRRWVSSPRICRRSGISRNFR